MCQEIRADVEKTQAPLEHDYQRDRQLKESAFLRGSGVARRAMSDTEILAELFRYHSPTPETLPKYAAINQAAKNFAEVILQTCPPGADRSDSIRKIREARMTANAAIALNGLSL